jgi:hypothetical protein
MHRLKSILQKIILADFKTTKKKFIDQGIEEDQIDTYFEDFKFLKDRNKIRSLEDKNIDNWGKKSWEEFVEFIDELKTEKSKSEEIREMKKEGADLVAEDDNWRVYKITTYEAARTYGSGKWCITRDEKWWKKYNRRSQFYFMLSKTRPEDDDWHKIALQLGKNGKKTYWDNTDTSHKKLPSDIHMVKYEELFEDTGREDLPVVEQIIEDINAFAEEEYEYLTDPEDNSDRAGYLYEQDLDFDNVDDDLKERLEVLENLAEKLGKDYESVVKDCCDVEFDTGYGRNYNELASMSIGGDERELPDELKDDYEALTEEEQEQVKRGVDSYFNGEYVSVGNDEDSFVLVLDEEKVEDAIKELSENLKVHKHLDTPKADLLALKGKNVSTRKLALEKTKNQEIIEKAYLDNDDGIRGLAASKIENPKMLEDIAKNTEEDTKVRVAAINNENYMDEAYLKNIVETYKDESDMSDWSLYTTAFDKIKDIKWLGKYVMQPGVNGSKRDDFVEMLATKRKGRKLAPNYVAYLKRLASLMLKEKQSFALTNIIKEMPDTEQTFFKKVVTLPTTRGYHNDDPRAIAIPKIQDEEFLKKFITKQIKTASQHSTEKNISLAFKGIHDQAYLTKCLFDRNYDSYDEHIAKNIKDEKVLVKWLKMTDGMDLNDVVDQIKSERAKISLIISPEIWAYRKADLLEKCSMKTIEKAFSIIEKSGDISEKTIDTLERIKARLMEIGEEDSLLFNSIKGYEAKKPAEES